MEDITSNVQPCNEIEKDSQFQSDKKIPFQMDFNEEITSRFNSQRFNEKEWMANRETTIKYDFNQSVSVFDVAAYVLKQIHPVTTMKLQKLIYYCQAWSLVWDEKPLFYEDIEAWANGPVIRDLFYFHQGTYLIDSIQVGNPDVLSKYQLETINAVLNYYGDKSPQWLIDLTHVEAPWGIVRERMPASERGHKVIPLDLIANYYSSLPPG